MIGIGVDILEDGIAMPSVQLMGDTELSLSDLAIISFMLYTGIYGKAFHEYIVEKLDEGQKAQFEKSLKAIFIASGQASSDDESEDFTDELQAARTPVISPLQTNENNDNG